MSTFAFIGFGEVARHLAPTIAAHPEHTVIGTLLRADPSSDTLARLDATCVAMLTGPTDLTAADVVISAVTADTAVEAALRALPGLRAGQRYLDLNSTTPMLKEHIAELIAPTHATLIDGMLSGAGTSVDGARVPITLAGPGATDLAELLCRCGLLTQAISDQVGTAAALKMVRGIVIKGLDALAFEARMVAEHFGIHDHLMASLTESLDRIPIQTFLDMLFETHCATAPRRAAEAGMIRDTAMAAGVTPIMASAVAAFFEQSAQLPGLANLAPEQRARKARHMRSSTSASFARQEHRPSHD